MDNKYIMAEKQEFEMKSVKKLNFLNYVGNNEGIEYVDISNFVKANNIQNSEYMFYIPKEIDDSIVSRIKGVKCTEDIYIMSHMFSGSVFKYLDLKELKTEKTMVFTNMFSDSIIYYLDLRNFEITEESKTSDMFSNFRCITLVLPKSITLMEKSKLYIYLFTLFDYAMVREFITFSKEFYDEFHRWFSETLDSKLIYK